MHRPWMIPLRDAPHGARSAVRAGEIVARRTGMLASYNTRCKNVLIHHTPVPDFGPLRLDAFHPDGCEKHWDDVMIDDAVLYIRMCQRPKAQKDRWAAQQKQNDTHAEKVAREKHMDDRRPGAIDMLNFKDQTRRGTRKLISA